MVSNVESAATLEELTALDCSGDILLLTGDLASEQLMPKNFPFDNPEHHRRLYALLEHKQPAAIIAPEIVDCAKLVELAEAIAHLLRNSGG